MPYLELAGFGSAALIRIFDLRYDLISALVERWRHSRGCCIAAQAPHRQECSHGRKLDL
ncbi:hypothetical protein Golob_000016 [Gossypium lobatum]|uniref:Aminotransferase-like plant mobile domain-containing protein n=1 Tax=Gossypium lobatum TaxID=34289 RepID=A0A7J8NL11_9ROSI|nr:hypothetical protein [Gossypium lobatum]